MLSKTPEERKANLKEYYHARSIAKSTEYKAASRKYYYEHQEQRKAEERAKYHADIEYWRAARKKWRHDHPKRVKAIARAYYKRCKARRLLALQQQQQQEQTHVEALEGGGPPCTLQPKGNNDEV